MASENSNPSLPDPIDQPLDRRSTTSSSFPSRHPPHDMSARVRGKRRAVSPRPDQRQPYPPSPESEPASPALAPDGNDDDDHDGNHHRLGRLASATDGPDERVEGEGMDMNMDMDKDGPALAPATARPIEPSPARPSSPAWHGYPTPESPPRSLAAPPSRQSTPAGLRSAFAPSTARISFPPYNHNSHPARPPTVHDPSPQDRRASLELNLGDPFSLDFLRPGTPSERGLHLVAAGRRPSLATGPRIEAAPETNAVADGGEEHLSSADGSLPTRAHRPARRHILLVDPQSTPAGADGDHTDDAQGALSDEDRAQIFGSLDTPMDIQTHPLYLPSLHHDTRGDAHEEEDEVGSPQGSEESAPSFLPLSLDSPPSPLGRSPIRRRRPASRSPTPRVDFSAPLPSTSFKRSFEEATAGSPAAASPLQGRLSDDDEPGPSSHPLAHSRGQGNCADGQDEGGERRLRTGHTNETGNKRVRQGAGPRSENGDGEEPEPPAVTGGRLNDSQDFAADALEVLSTVGRSADEVARSRRSVGSAQGTDSSSQESQATARAAMPSVEEMLRNFGRTGGDDDGTAARGQRHLGEDQAPHVWRGPPQPISIPATRAITDSEAGGALAQTASSPSTHHDRDGQDEVASQAAWSRDHHDFLDMLHSPDIDLHLRPPGGRPSSDSQLSSRASPWPHADATAASSRNNALSPPNFLSPGLDDASASPSAGSMSVELGTARSAGSEASGASTTARGTGGRGASPLSPQWLDMDFGSDFDEMDEVSRLWSPEELGGAASPRSDDVGGRRSTPTTFGSPAAAPGLRQQPGSASLSTRSRHDLGSTLPSSFLPASSLLHDRRNSHGAPASFFDFGPSRQDALARALSQRNESGESAGSSSLDSPRRRLGLVDDDGRLHGSTSWHGPQRRELNGTLNAEVSDRPILPQIVTSDTRSHAPYVSRLLLDRRRAEQDARRGPTGMSVASRVGSSFSTAAATANTPTGSNTVHDRNTGPLWGELRAARQNANNNVRPSEHSLHRPSSLFDWANRPDDISSRIAHTPAGGYSTNLPASMTGTSSARLSGTLGRSNTAAGTPTSSGRRFGALDPSGRLRGPTRSQNESWLSLSPPGSSTGPDDAYRLLTAEIERSTFGAAPRQPASAPSRRRTTTGAFSRRYREDGPAGGEEDRIDDDFNRLLADSSQFLDFVRRRREELAMTSSRFAREAGISDHGLGRSREETGDAAGGNAERREHAELPSLSHPFGRRGSDVAGRLGSRDTSSSADGDPRSRLPSLPRIRPRSPLALQFGDDRRDDSSRAEGIPALDSHLDRLGERPWRRVGGESAAAAGRSPQRPEARSSLLSDGTRGDEPRLSSGPDRSPGRFGPLSSPTASSRPGLRPLTLSARRQLGPLPPLSPFEIGTIGADRSEDDHLRWFFPDRWNDEQVRRGQGQDGQEHRQQHRFQQLRHPYGSLSASTTPMRPRWLEGGRSSFRRDGESGSPEDQTTTDSLQSLRLSPLALASSNANATSSGAAVTSRFDRADGDDEDSRWPLSGGPPFSSRRHRPSNDLEPGDGISQPDEGRDDRTFTSLRRERLRRWRDILNDPSSSRSQPAGSSPSTGHPSLSSLRYLPSPFGPTTSGRSPSAAQTPATATGWGSEFNRSFLADDAPTSSLRRRSSSSRVHSSSDASPVSSRNPGDSHTDRTGRFGFSAAAARGETDRESRWQDNALRLARMSAQLRSTQNHRQDRLERLLRERLLNRQEQEQEQELADATEDLLDRYRLGDWPSSSALDDIDDEDDLDVEFAARRRPFHLFGVFGWGTGLGSDIASDPANYLADDDWERTNTYEGLLHLGARVGEVRLRHTPGHVVAGLPTCLYRNWRGGSCAEGDPTSTEFRPGRSREDASLEKETKCGICLDEYDPFDLLMSLPCNHALHEACLKTWLQSANSCPICRQAVASSASMPTAPMRSSAASASGSSGSSSAQASTSSSIGGGPSSSSSRTQPSDRTPSERDPDAGGREGERDTARRNEPAPRLWSDVLREIEDL